MTSIKSREGEREYDVHWAFDDPALAPGGQLPPGLTCVFRVKNEARNLPWVLPPMFRAVQRIVLVDNGSDDGTAEVGHAVAEQCGAADRYTSLEYPFVVARAGAAHRATPADSVHSLTHFYNWSFSQVRTAYSMKWDGDMVLTPEGEAMLADLSWQLESSKAVVVVPRHPLTVVDERTAYLDIGMRFNEPWIYPMGPEFTFVKAFDWEVREWPETSPRIELPEGLAIELKWLDADEFGHWTDPKDFTRARTPRKLREWEVDQAIRRGTPEAIDGLVRIDAPAGTHVIEHVLHTWLPARPRPLVRKRLRAPESVGASATPVQGAAGDEAAESPPVAPGDERARKGLADILYTELLKANQPCAVLLHQDLSHVRSRIPADVDIIDLPIDAMPDGDRYATLFLLAPDVDALQRATAVLPATRGTKTVGVWLEWAASAPNFRPRDEWGPVLSRASRRDEDEFLTWVRLKRWNPGRQLLADLARQALAPGLTPREGVRIALCGDVLAPPGEPDAPRLGRLEEAVSDGVDVPPDVVVSDHEPDAPLGEHHVTGRAPVVVVPALASGPLAIGPLEERVLNPIGFEYDAPNPDGVLLVAGDAIVLRHHAGEVPTSSARGATARMVHELRTTRAVRLAWPTQEHLGYARTVAGLAMTGTPLSTSEVPPWARDLLGDTVADALSAPVDFDEPLAREEHSIVARRAALGEFSASAWRRRVLQHSPLRPRGDESVSIVLASKREENLEHVLTQVRRQRGAELELVLCPHGWDVDPARVRDLVGPDVAVQVVPQSGETLFGDVLARGVEAAHGRLVLKLDDDDWYGPDVVADLLLARRYSGAELVGMPAEMLYLAPLDRTVRRTDPSECPGKFVAGGTMMIERDLLRSLGNFRPVRRFVDASLLNDLIAAGGTIYRTQGLGYLFRRSDSGHTWQADIEYFLDPERLAGSWEGFRPSRLMELDGPD